MADRCIGNASPAVRAVWDTLRTELNMGQYLDVLGTAPQLARPDMPEIEGFTQRPADRTGQQHVDLGLDVAHELAGLLE